MNYISNMVDNHVTSPQIPFLLQMNIKILIVPLIRLNPLIMPTNTEEVFITDENRAIEMCPVCIACRSVAASYNSDSLADAAITSAEAIGWVVLKSNDRL